MQPSHHKTLISNATATLRLAGPVWIAQMAMCAAGFVDTVMSGHYSRVDLAGVATGSSVWFPLFLALTGLLMSASPMTSHHHGAGRDDEIRTVTHSGLVVALIMSLLAVWLLLHAAPLFALLHTPADIQAVSLRYLKWLTPGLPAMAGYILLKSQSEGLGDTRTQMKVAVLSLTINIFCNWVFINGRLGLPAMGGAGCGLATAISFWVMFIAMSCHMKFSPGVASLQLLSLPFRPRRREITEILRLGSPIALTLFMEGSIFACISLLIGHLGTLPVAGHQVVLNFSGLLYAIPLSISIATTIRVGQAVGRGDSGQAADASYGALAAAVTMAVITMVLTILLRHQIVRLYTPDPQVQHLAEGLLLLAAAYQISDATAALCMGALRGFKDTRIPMFLTLFAYWIIALPFGCTLGLTDHIVPALGPAGFWISLIIGLTTSGSLLLLRLIRVNRKFARRQGRHAKAAG